MLVRQCFLRCALAHKRVSFLRSTNAAVVVQKAVRGYLALSKYQRHRRAVIALQACLRYDADHAPDLPIVTLGGDVCCAVEHRCLGPERYTCDVR